jgi:hypothetical protein
MRHFVFRITFIIGKISLLLATFLIGFASTSLWLELSPPIVTLCEVAKNPKQYQGKTVRLATSVQTHYGYFFFRDENCNFGGLDAVIDLPEDYKPKSEQVQNFISENNENYLSAQIMITGEIDTTRKYQDYSPKFVIKATEVELTSEVTVESEDK